MLAGEGRNEPLWAGRVLFHRVCYVSSQPDAFEAAAALIVTGITPKSIPVIYTHSSRHDGCDADKSRCKCVHAVGPWVWQIIGGRL